MKSKNDLTRLKDSTLASRVRRNKCNDCLQELINRHNGIFFSTAKRFSRYGITLEEAKGEKDYIVYSSALTYKPTKGSKFSTWLANQTKFYFLNLRNNHIKYAARHYTDLDPETTEFMIDSYLSSQEDSPTKKEILNVLRDLLDQVGNKNIRDAVYYRYFSDKTRILNYSEVGDILNVTPQTALNWHNKFIDLAKKKLTSTNNTDMI